MTWLAATSIHSRDPTFWQVLSSLRQLCDVHSKLHAIINLFDNEEPIEMRRQLLQAHDWLPSRFESVWVPGMKTYLWKRVLTPEKTRGADIIWLFDADIAVHPAVMPLSAIVHSMMATKASCAQPAIRAYSAKEGDVRWPEHRGKPQGTIHPWLYDRHAHVSCGPAESHTSPRLDRADLLLTRMRSECWQVCRNDGQVCRAADAALHARRVGGGPRAGALAANGYASRCF